MSQQKEQYTYQEWQAYEKVARILKAGADSEKEPVNKEIVPDEKKKLSDEDIKNIDRIVDPFIPLVNQNYSISYQEDI